MTQERPHAIIEKVSPFAVDDVSILQQENIQLRKRVRLLQRQIDQLEKLADSDPLTSLFNRRGLVRELERAIQRRRRYGIEAALIILDVDRFKSVNDVQGHVVGDATLLFIAETLTTLVRRVDVVGRLGGDEFAILLDHLTEADAQAKAASMTASVTRRMNGVAGVSDGVTLSFGVAALRPDESVDDVLARADRMMYASRAAHRSER